MIAAPAPGRVRRLLVLRPRALGDVLLATPALRALRSGFPTAAIEVAVDAGLESVLRRNPHVDRLWLLPRGGGARAWWPIYAGIARAGFDLVLDLHGSPRTAFMAVWSRAPHRFGYALRGRGRFYNHRVPRDSDRDGIRRPLYAARINLEMVARCGVRGAVLEDTTLVLPPEPQAEARMEKLLASVAAGRPRIGMSAAGTWPAKTWPEASWARTADALADAGATILLLWGPGERAVAERVRASMLRPAVILPETNLDELAAVIGRLDLLIAHDSGVRHVAVARGTPTLALYGPTDPRNWNPVHGPHHGVRAQLPCVGCNLTACAHHLCMRLLQPTGVARRALEILASNLDARPACGS